jgi:hypothetical protein
MTTVYNIHKKQKTNKFFSQTKNNLQDKNSRTKII